MTGKSPGMSNWVDRGDFTETGHLEEVCLEGRQLEELTPRRGNSPVLSTQLNLYECVLKGDKSQPNKQQLKIQLHENGGGCLGQQSSFLPQGMFRKTLDDHL